MLNRFANEAAIRFVQSAKYLFLEVAKVLFGTVEVCIITDTVLCFFFFFFIICSKEREGLASLMPGCLIIQVPIQMT